MAIKRRKRGWPHALPQLWDNPSFAAFFQRHFHYELHAQQLELHAWYCSHLGSKQTKVLLAMRGIGKTEVISIASVAYSLLRDSNQTWLIICKSKDACRNIVRAIAHILRVYRLLKSCTADAVNLYGNGRKEPSVKGLPAGSDIRGSHYTHCLLDDLVTDKDAFAAARLRSWERYQEVLSVTQDVTAIGQIAHEECLHSRLRQQALNGNPHIVLKEFWWDAVDESLKEILGLRLEELRGKLHIRALGCNYLGLHLLDETAPFSGLESRIMAVRDWRLSRPCAYLDPAWTDGADKTALCILAWHKGLNGLQPVARLYAWRLSAVRQAAAIIEICREMGVRKLYIESNGSSGRVKEGGAIAYFKRLAVDFRVEGRHTSQSKTQKILQNVGLWLEELVLDSASDAQALQDILAWRGLGSCEDDAIDALASALKITLPKRV